MTTSNKMVIGILAAVVIITGIGYAAISGQVLNITGTLSAAATDSEFNVKFTKVQKATGNDGNVTATIDGDKAATFSVSGLKVKGERAEATYTIKNESAEGIAANIETTLTATNEAYFDVTVEGPEKAIINPGEETTVTIIAELIKTPITAQTSNVTVQLEATAEEVDNEGGTSTGEAETFQFSLNGSTYTAEKGMTWEEWIFSDYNIDFDNTRYYFLSSQNRVYLLSEPAGDDERWEIITVYCYNFLEGDDYKEFAPAPDTLISTYVSPELSEYVCSLEGFLGDEYHDENNVVYKN